MPPLNAERTHWLGALSTFRGLAKIWVMFHNDVVFMERVSVTWAAKLFDRGYLAVDMFLALSGFLLTYHYRHHFQGFERREFLRFLAMRLARIYPLYFLVLTLRVCFETAQLIGSSCYQIDFGPQPFTQANTVGKLVANYLMVQAWGPYDEATWVPAFWSVSAEWFAYLLFPLFIVAGFWLLKRGWLKAAASLLVIVCVGALVTGSVVFGMLEFPMQYSLLRCVPMFLIGMLLATQHDRMRAWATRTSQNQTFVNASLVVSMFTIVGGLFGGLDDLVIAALLVHIITVGPLASGGLERWLNGSLLVGLGSLSYAIYLTHMPMQRVIDIFEQQLGRPYHDSLLWLGVVRLGAVLAISYYLHRQFEQPWRDRIRALVNRRFAVMNREGPKEHEGQSAES